MSPMRLVSIQPTVLFVRHESALKQLARVQVANDGPAQPAHLHLQGAGLDGRVELGVIGSGATSCDAHLPDLREPARLQIELWASDALHDQTELDWQPQRHWQVHLVQYAHHDPGYTDLPSNVLAEYDGFMDDVLRYCAETEHWAEEDAKFRYLCEQAWSVVHYVAHRPPEAVERLMHHVDNGQIEFTALFGNQTLELCGHEELVRLLYPAFALKRRYGVEIASAVHNDIPGFAWGLASVLAGAGVRYLTVGVPAWYYGLGADRVHALWDTQAALPLQTPSACWWEGPDGARVLLWYNLHGMDEWQPYNEAQALAELPGRLGALADQGYPYDMVPYTVRGGYRDNAPPTLRYAHLVQAWNRRWAYPHLINTTVTPFLRAFEQRWGHTLKTLRGDVPGTDYPAAATCTPGETAVNRGAHDTLLAAERLASLAAMLAPYDYPAAQLERAYGEAMFYDEHCWSMGQPGGPASDATWAEKGLHAHRAAALAHDVLVKASNSLADQISFPESACYLTVFNPLSHARSDVVRVTGHPWEPCGSPMFEAQSAGPGGFPALVPGRAAGRDVVNPPAELFERPFELLDAATGEVVPYQLSVLDTPQAAQPWAPERYALGQNDRRYLRELAFTARDLPALGYSSYRLRPCQEWPRYDSELVATESLIENRFYRLALDPARGVISSLYDKALGRELLDQAAPHSLGQCIVRSCATGEERVARVASVSVSQVGPVYATLRLTAEAWGWPRITHEITLYRDLERIDLAYRILKDSTATIESFIAFPFHCDNPRVHYEGPCAVIEPLRDQWPGSNTDYYAVQHWASVDSAEGKDAWGVTWTPLDTPMAEFGGLWPGYVSGAHHGVRGPHYGHAFLRPGELRRGHIYALVGYNNFCTNFLNVHPGEFLVRYAFAAHAGDWRTGGANEFGWCAANPPLPVWMRGPRAGDLLASASFCGVAPHNVRLLTLKRAENGDGYILRLIETEGNATEATVSLPRVEVLRAVQTNLAEEDQRALGCALHEVTVSLKAFGMATVRLAVGQA